MLLKILNRILIVLFAFFIYTYLEPATPYYATDINEIEFVSFNYQVNDQNCTTVICFLNYNRTLHETASSQSRWRNKTFPFTDKDIPKDVNKFVLNKFNTTFVCFRGPAKYFDIHVDGSLKIKAIQLLWLTVIVIVAAFLMSIFCFFALQIYSELVRHPLLFVMVVTAVITVINQYVAIKLTTSHKRMKV